MKRKRALITVELVDESIGQDDRAIEREILEWLNEEKGMPWVREAKSVAVKDC
ncbi:MAG: hypothetical protein QHH24_04090 [Candidatus Bathyarchaeota archaeon]|nr:hypothetical protein [Candidatus Bathyarchaeota archaeon]